MQHSGGTKHITEGIREAYPSWKREGDGGSFRENLVCVSWLRIGSIHAVGCGKRGWSGRHRESILYHPDSIDEQAQGVIIACWYLGTIS